MKLTPPEFWDTGVYQMPSRGKAAQDARDIIKQFWESSDAPYIELASVTPEMKRLHQMIQHTESLIAGDMARRNRIKRAGHRRGMPYSRGAHWFPISEIPVSMSAEIEYIGHIPGMRLTAVNKDGTITSHWSGFYGVAIGPQPGLGRIVT